MRTRNFLASILLMLLLIVSVVEGQDTPNAPPRTSANELTASISGTVVRKDDGTPVKAATVRLENNEDRDHTIATRTAADGSFELHNLPMGQYRLKVSQNGYAEYEYGQKTASDPGATFTLRAGQKMSELVLPLSRAAVIAGRIVDQDGEPMANAMVSALRQVYRDGRRQLEPIDVDRSDDRGDFRLFGLKPGRYFVSAQPQVWNRVVGDAEFSNPGKQSGDRAYAKMYYPGVTSASKASSFSVKEGEEVSSADILMKEVTVFRIHGKVMNFVSSNRNHETSVELQGRSQEVTWEFFGGAPRVKADGSFEIAEVLPGEYRLTAFFNEDGKFYSGTQDVDVTNGDVDGITIAITPGVSLPGTLVWDGKPSLSPGEANVFVTAQPLQVGMFWFGRTNLNSDRTFTFKDVPQGEFRVGVDGLSKDCYIKEIRQGETTLSDDILRVTRGTVASLQVTVSSKGGRIEGMVTTDEDLPAAGVWVVAVPEESKRKQQRLYKSFTTDQYGHFELRGMTPGKYALFAWNGVEPDAWQDADFLKPFEEKGIAIEVRDGDAQTLELKLLGSAESSVK